MALMKLFYLFQHRKYTFLWFPVNFYRKLREFNHATQLDNLEFCIEKLISSNYLPTTIFQIDIRTIRKSSKIAKSNQKRHLSTLTFLVIVSVFKRVVLWELSRSTDLFSGEKITPFVMWLSIVEPMEKSRAQVYFCRLPSLIWPHYPCCDICDSHWL